MRYYSTRGEAEKMEAAQAILKGLAPDGGLFVPADRLKPYATNNLPEGSYQDLAKTVLKPFLADFSDADLESTIHNAYNIHTFDHQTVTPLIKLSDQLHILELWHGPTCAFKDIALQILPHFINTALAKNNKNNEVVILTATSGDTGKSALEGFRDVPGIRIIVYFPEKGVSEIQKLQMITQEGRNVGVCAVKGNFDDTQKRVKQIFNDQELAAQLQEAGYSLSSANSINWGRLLPQIIYYFAAYQELIRQNSLQPGQKVNFVVPTGNFGNILAGYYARQLGLPVNRLICAANRNNVLSDFINSGIYDSRRQFYNSLSPSMDILVSSNLERLLFEITGHDAKRISVWMKQLTEAGQYQVDHATLEKLTELFWSDYADDDETLTTIADTYQDFNYLLDPHTAVGKNVLDKYLGQGKEQCPSVILSTASPFKFPSSTIRALFNSERFNGVTELEMIKIMGRETGIPVPHNLATLDQMPIRHQKVIKPKEMYSHLLQTLAVK